VREIGGCKGCWRKRSKRSKRRRTKLLEMKSKTVVISERTNRNEGTWTTA
tara:strand:- start:354 stop:503 length:150 start_codon:yes stop_codon:yes gene_type:complete